MALLYPNEITQLLSLLLQKFADSFEYEKGVIFSFGDKKDDDTGTVTKICKVSDEELDTLDNSAQTPEL